MKTSLLLTARRSTPIQPFLRIDLPSGNTFETLSINTQNIEDGRIQRSDATEDRAEAMRQLQAE